MMHSYLIINAFKSIISNVRKLKQKAPEKQVLGNKYNNNNNKNK